MTHPRKNKRRSHRKAVRLTADEYEQLEKKLSTSGLHFSEFVRQMIFNGKVVVHPASEQLAELIFLLRKGLNNFNQAVRLGHIDGHLPYWIDETRDDLELATEKLLDLTLSHEPNC